MEFGWINFIGAVIVLLILVPNIIYSMKNKEPTPSISNKTMTIIEQIGRYACIVFMWLPLFTWKSIITNLRKPILSFVLTE